MKSFLESAKNADLDQLVKELAARTGVLFTRPHDGSCGGGKVLLAALQSGPKIVFDITKVSRVFEIVQTVAEAEAKLVEG